MKELDPDWVLRANCRDGEDPNALFVTLKLQAAAKRICQGCPVQTECLAYALDSGSEWGVWGGMTEAERRRFVLKNPRVKDWRKYFTNLLNGGGGQQCLA